MKGNSPTVPSAVCSTRTLKSFATVIITLTCFIITPTLTMPTASIKNAPPHKPCGSDYECPDKFYCYTRISPLKYCSPCYLCSRVNRAAASGCAKSRAECGPCLPGYHALGIMCSRVPDDFGPENPNSNVKTERESTEAGFPWWILCVVGASILVFVVVIIAILILRKRPRWRSGHRTSRIDKDIELDQQNAFKSFPPSAPPPQYEESEQYNRHLAHAAFVVRESSQQRNPMSLPPELLNSQDIIVIDDNEEPLDDQQDVLLDAIEHEFQAQEQEEPEGAADPVPNGDNVGDGWEHQDISLHEESVHLEDPIDLNDQAAAAEPLEGENQILDRADGNNSPFELMLGIRFDVAVFWPELAVSMDQEMPLHRSRNDSGVADTSAHSSMDHIVPNVDNHNDNIGTGSGPQAGSVPHAGGRLHNQGPLSLVREPFSYSSNDEGFSNDETGEGSSLYLNETDDHDLEHENSDLMEVSLDLD